jgi:hypothetical protein
MGRDEEGEKKKGTTDLLEPGKERFENKASKKSGPVFEIKRLSARSAHGPPIVYSVAIYEKRF